VRAKPNQENIFIDSISIDDSDIFTRDVFTGIDLNQIIARDRQNH